MGCETLPPGAYLCRIDVGVHGFEVQFYGEKRGWGTSSAPTVRAVTVPSQLSYSKQIIAGAAVGHRWT